MPGHAPAPVVAKVLDSVDQTFDTLRSRGAVLYGREGCVWTQRQRALLGPRADAVTYVNCDAEARRCSAAGVLAVPAWGLGRREGSGGGGAAAAAGPIVVGFQRMPQLLALAFADGAALERLSKSSLEGVAGAGGSRGGEACV